MRRLSIALVFVLFVQPLSAQAPFGASDALFMGPVWSPKYYRDYQAAWVLWGPSNEDSPFKKARAAGVKVAASFWCLTAGPERLHENAALAEAVCRDIEGEPIAVPWQADAVYKGTPTWFGCTNAPAFQELLIWRADSAAMAHPDGLHIDDPQGSLATLDWAGGCYCGHCNAAFNAWLREHDSPALRREAGVDDWAGFDYPALVRRSAPTRALSIARAGSLPLRWAFKRFQVEARVKGLSLLRDRVRAATRMDLPFSVNAYFSKPGSDFMALAPITSHLVAEVEHHAEAGSARLWEAAQAYRQAEALERPLASTAGGSDYAWVKARGATDLVRLWIALAFAMGQRMMVPNPERQWCHTPALGTHWYAAPVEPFAPLYRFAREQAGLLEGFKTLGPTRVRSLAGVDLADEDNREAAARELSACTGPMTAGAHVWIFPRGHADGRLVLHLINTQYSPALNLLAPAVDVRVAFPAAWLPKGGRRIRLLRPGSPSGTLALELEGSQAVFVVPVFDVWAVAEVQS